MPTPSWEDLDVFLGLDGFAVEAQLLFADGSEAVARVIFDEAFYDPQAGEYVMEGTQPRMLGKEAELGQLARGDVVVVGGVSYDVTAGAQEDGTGMATVILARAAG